MERIQVLFNKYYQKAASPREREELFGLLRSAEPDMLQHLISQAGLNLEATEEIVSEVRSNQILANILRPEDQEEPKAAIIPYPARIPRYRWISVAAAILLVAVYYFWQPAWMHNKPADIRPGGNRATLTLADGTKVELDSTQSSIIVQDEQVAYNDGRKVEGVKSRGEGPRAPETYNVEHTTYNTLTIPKGGQYQVILVDGTKVWLNSSSILKYPSRFSRDKREIFLEGEAYLDVAQIKDKPFMIICRGQTIDVIGTALNVNAYSDEKVAKTTLVEGKVRVSVPASHTSRLLSPTQQTLVKGDSLLVGPADVATTIAWKAGVFQFKKTPFAEIMRQLARWYDLEIVYKGNVPQESFTGSMGRNVNLSTVLKILDESGIVMNVVGKKIVIE